MSLSCFKAYDVRGRVGVDFGPDEARRIGAALVRVTGAGSVVLGRDCRESSDAIADAVAEGVAGQGAAVLDLGLAGTEEVYFATDHAGAGAGVAVTASHNPIDWNGLKMVGPGSRPLTDPEFREVARLSDEVLPVVSVAGRQALDCRGAYAARVAGFAGDGPFRPLTILANAGNGVAGPAFDAILRRLDAAGVPLSVERMHWTPDGTFPNGIPNPLLPENRPATSAAVLAAGADFGLAWDGDFDRCFLFDEQGGFVDGEYVVALLARAFLAREPGATVVHDPRVIGAVTGAVADAGGRAVASKTGHAFVKAAMRAEDAVYGGEMSAHHYFRDFMFCDSGMVPWVALVALLGRDDRPLSAHVDALRRAHPSSGEINFRVDDVPAAIARVEAALRPEAVGEDRLDGLSLTFDGWRLNLRASNTEPVLRLNVEGAGDMEAVEAGVARVTALIRGDAPAG